MVMFFVAGLVLPLARSMRLPLAHDEHQFIASGKLLEQQLAFPYKDYPYNHMPYLVFVYGGLFAASNHLLLVARCFTVLCAWLALAAIFGYGFSILRNMQQSHRLLWATGFGSILIFNPLFAYANGWAWNHAAAVLPAMLAAIFLGRAVPGEERSRELALSGLLLGVSIGVRLQFAPLVCPFVLHLLLRSGAWSTKRNVVMVWGCGLAVGLLPAGIMCLLWPEQFVYGNFVYPRFHRLFNIHSGVTEAMGLGSKLVFFGRKILFMPGMLLLMVAYLWVSHRLLRDRLLAMSETTLWKLATLCLPFLLAGAMAPTPSHPQYLYALVPFLLLGLMSGVATLAQGATQAFGFIRRGLIAITVLVTVCGLPYYRALPGLLKWEDWTPLRVHTIGQEIKGVVKGGVVMTIGPIYPLEGGAAICPEMATGELTWRMGFLLPKEKRKRVGVACEQDLSELLAKHRPWILAGTERPDAEQSIMDVALSAGWRRVPIAKGTMCLFEPPASVLSSVIP